MVDRQRDLCAQRPGSQSVLSPVRGTPVQFSVVGAGMFMNECRGGVKDRRGPDTKSSAEEALTWTTGGEALKMSLES